MTADLTSDEGPVEFLAARIWLPGKGCVHVRSNRVPDEIARLLLDSADALMDIDRLVVHRIPDMEPDSISDETHWSLLPVPRRSAWSAAYFAEERPDPDNPQRTATFVWIALKSSHLADPVAPALLPSSPEHLLKCHLVPLGSAAPDPAAAAVFAVQTGRWWFGEQSGRFQRAVLIGVIALALIIYWLCQHFVS